MKRLSIILLALLFGFTVNTAVARVKNQPKKQADKELKKEAKAERIALRKLNGNDVNVLAKNSFISDFGNIPEVKWHRADYFDEARFIKNGTLTTAYYDFEGTLVGTTQAKTFADIPTAAQNEIKTRYRDYSIGSVIFYDDNELNATDMVLYGMQFDDMDNYFVELSKGTSKIVLRVDEKGIVTFFKDL
jgi:hypothetical protein